MGVTRESKLADLGLELVEPPKPAGSYIPALLVGDLLYVSGQGPKKSDGTFATGVVGKDLTTEEAYKHAQLAGATVLSIVKSQVRTLANVRRVIKVLGMVNAAPDFTDHPKVIDGCSDLFIHIFGDSGKHVRSAVGMSSLPHGISVEIEAIFQIEPGGLAY